MKTSELIAELQREAALVWPLDPEVVTQDSNCYPRPITRVEHGESLATRLVLRGDTPPPTDWKMDYLSAEEYEFIYALRLTSASARNKVLAMFSRASEAVTA
ncbi:hypothetical protein IGB42_01821 [Andreprevotia sp. IGB-42]|uniref:hypothetical protein n=1 Tax=Andreprevotia sp. IGB-42 TaxID=2497473 RepID=UPI001358403F|nr:hypothetical protein [Andreprevotia sp. IGB-42]KAF0813470.1 hypothetical protein IGB42_01821 [Andreprevotia sp. IGB-42]